MSEKTVFISYRRDATGKAFARNVHRELTQRGYDVFLDVESLEPGKWATQILTQVPLRSHFLVLLTPGALERCADENDWVRRECLEALASQRNFVPVREESVNISEMRKSCPECLKPLFEFQMANLEHTSFAADIQQLVSHFIPPHKAPKPKPSPQPLPPTYPGAPAPDADGLIPDNLPSGYLGREFEGRDAFLERLRLALQSQTHAAAITQVKPLATSVAGLGGMGKTHTAVAYADRYRADYSALLFVSGESPERLNATLADLSGVLDLEDPSAPPAPETQRVQTVLGWLQRHKGWLLIIDNVDSPEAVHALNQHLGQLKAGHVLITSRLHEWADNITALDLEVLLPEDAATLLLKLTKHPNPEDPQARKDALQLAEELGRLPLALQQAAGYIREQNLTLAQAHTFYQQQASELLGWFNQLTVPYSAPEDIGPRPVLFTWKASFDRLTPEQRDWLRVFAYFAPDRIPQWLIESAPDASDETKALHHSARQALAAAAGYCLITRHQDPQGFKLHRLVQQVIRLQSTSEEKTQALTQAIRLIQRNYSGHPQDFRTWQRWNLLQPHALALCDHSPDDPSPKTLSWLLNCIGVLLHNKALYAQAEPLLRRALKLHEASLGKDHPEVASSLNNLAQLLKATDRLTEAEPLLRRALEIGEASFGKDDPNVAIRLNNLATLLHATNRHTEAEPLMRRALEIDEASFGKEHPNVARHLNNLAMLLHATDRSAEAEPLMRRALEIDEARLGKDQPNVAIELHNLALLLQATDRHTEAEPLMQRAVDIFLATLGPEHPRTKTVQNNLAVLQAKIRKQEG
ncbi:MAG: toll/interleukin-1 receptor domain-containing protein [Verrucomicrobiaceae bacterium]|nr:toll/interleukin-1 receptor domain-containing protein [Verrucomicrobiaceae bacterium]